jgi:hypothetical protein
MPDLGPGPLMCIKSVACAGCGEGVNQGCMYQCEELVEPGFLMTIILGPCGCGEFHPYVALRGKSHAYCPNCFAPLGDPDAVIKETDEPSDAKRREDDCYDLPKVPVKETENV